MTQLDLNGNVVKEEKKRNFEHSDEAAYLRWREKNPFERCCHCGRTVYADTFGDDVIPSGIYCDTCSGYECDGCSCDIWEGGDE